MSAASQMVIEQQAEWVTVVTIAPEPSAAPLPPKREGKRLPAPQPDPRLYAADVQERADTLYKRPYHLSQVQRREIAAQLDAEAEAERVYRLRQYGYTGVCASGLCAPARATLTGR